MPPRLLTHKLLFLSVIGLDNGTVLGRRWSILEWNGQPLTDVKESAEKRLIAFQLCLEL